MRVAVFGICGKMGRAIGKELIKEKDIEIVAGFDVSDAGKDIGSILGTDETGALVYDRYEKIEKLLPQTIIDFTVADVAVETINWAIENGINVIVGTTGIDKKELENIKQKTEKSKSKVLIVPNFSIGAVIMVKISRLIAGYFDDCEIIEMHHDKKKDAPSGTSVLTSEAIAESRKFNQERLKEFESENAEGSRGSFLNGVHIHSIRLPGLLAHQRVVFGTRGQTVTISHDSIDRSSFYPGVLLAIRGLDRLGSFTYGLDKLIEI
ncbi:MAG: 4-hydroxy-tetrahydrodipicolinate reductase [Actinomycetota bacterium]